MSSIPTSDGGAVALGARTDEDQQQRRMLVVRRLMEQGVPIRALEVLLPGWEAEIAAVLDHDQRQRRGA